MPCYKPIDAWYSPYFNVSGKPRLTFNPSKAINATDRLELPCGRCIGCRLDKSREWAIRCYHESQMHQNNIFITLTYDDYHLPPFDSLDKSHFQKFIRALRKKSKQQIRYYMCGEYGDQTARPHYHALLFGYEFPDQELWLVREETRILRSKLLEQIWDHGNSEIGACTFQSAGYVARYIMKKQNGARGKAHYGKRIPEYTDMSRNKGIGYTWFQKYKTDVFPSDECITPDGRKMPAPKYYRELLLREDPQLYEKLRDVRVEKAKNNKDNSESRLAVREICKSAKAERLKRNFL